MKNFLKKASIILIILAELSCKSGVQNNYVQANDIPFYKQQKAQDCGPTCLKMVAEAFGKKYDSQHLMKITNFSEKDGVSLLDLSDAANKIGFKTLAAKTTFQKLKTCPLPCIVHLPENHFVVISKIDSRNVYIVDPADGRHTIPINQFCKSWYTKEDSLGIVLLFEIKQ